MLGKFRFIALKLIRTTLKPSAILTNGIRSFASNGNPSSNEERIYIEDRKEKGYVILKMNRNPVNSLNTQFLTELAIQIEKLNNAKDIKGVVLASNMPKVFSAGLHIPDLYQVQPEPLRQMFGALQDVWIQLYGSNKIFIAAINGHALAGGCLLALACDYRIMASGPSTIGLTESLLGVKCPFWLEAAMVNTIGNRNAERAIQLGLVFSPEEALKINMIDEICAKSDVLAKAEEQMQKWCKIPTIARELTKTSMRRDRLSELLARRKSDSDEWCGIVEMDTTQKALKSYLDQLKNRNKQ